MMILSGNYMDEEEVEHRNNKPNLWIPRIPESGYPDFTNEFDDAVDGTVSFYPHLFIDPLDGRLFYTGPEGSGQDKCEKHNPATGAWYQSGVPQYGLVPNVERTYASAVNVDGFVLKSGGSVDATGTDAIKTTLSIDLNGARTWAARADMNERRMNHTLVALPDGKVLAVGGNLENTFDTGGLIEPRVKPEMFDTLNPTGGWTMLSRPEDDVDLIPRGYHSTALLTPNAEIVIAGGENTGNPDSSGNDQRKMQIFSPPYGGDMDWKNVSGKRPALGSVSSTTLVGNTFQVPYTVPSGRTLTKLSLISLSASTHAFNQHQIVTFLPFSDSSGTATVQWQARHAYLPAGYYMLFAVDSAGAPSVAKIVKLLGYEPFYVESLVLYNYATAGAAITAANSLYLADNLRYGPYRSGTSPTGVQMVVEGTSPIAEPSRLAFDVESKVDKINGASGDDVHVIVEGYDWVSSTYVQFGVSNPDLVRGDPTSSSHETRVSVLNPTSVAASRFVKTSDSSNRTKVRIIWVDEGDSSLFDFQVDMLRWAARS